jgi:hypothetical protein
MEMAKRDDHCHRFHPTRSSIEEAMNLFLTEISQNLSEGIVPSGYRISSMSKSLISFVIGGF